MIRPGDQTRRKLRTQRKFEMKDSVGISRRCQSHIKVNLDLNKDAFQSTCRAEVGLTVIVLDAAHASLANSLPFRQNIRLQCKWYGGSNRNFPEQMDDLRGYSTSSIPTGRNGNYRQFICTKFPFPLCFLLEPSRKFFNLPMRSQVWNE